MAFLIREHRRHVIDGRTDGQTDRQRDRQTDGVQHLMRFPRGHDNRTACLFELLIFRRRILCIPEVKYDGISELFFKLCNSWCS